MSKLEDVLGIYEIGESTPLDVDALTDAQAKQLVTAICAKLKPFRSLASLPFSGRCQNIFANNDLRHVIDLQRLTSHEIARLKNCGSTSRREVITTLKTCCDIDVPNWGYDAMKGIVGRGARR